MSSIALIDDKISQTLHLRQAAKVLSISKNDLKIELKKINVISKHSSEKLINKEVNNEETNQILKDLQSTYIEEFQLMRLLINYGTFLYHLNDKQK